MKISICNLWSINNAGRPAIKCRLTIPDTRKPSSVFCHLSSTTVENPLQTDHFLTNKPNFPKSQMNVKAYKTKKYDNWTLGECGKNKANTNPIQTQYEPKSNPIRTQIKPKQSQFLYHWFPFLFTIASKSCEIDKEFCV